ncbi:uncharacterized protein A4U43_C03F13130 [Asparagus officinalis]|uniref:DYW domain-containing protein n=1 Tax=Asparagus officinalis TaxID=4686 RepID=A0A5P1FA88_ASPOF|nr:pentatricopeptide repeat-containing protein At5g65570 [Asparagus officinalis]ONK75082.1 uncharacterized protein A4U43_C03F13130 [Asparagus officinalis]
MKPSAFKILCASSSSAASKSSSLISTPSTPSPFNHYIPLLHKSSSNKSLTQTKQIHLQMVVANFPYIALGNKLVDSYLKSGAVDSARQLFDEMPHPHIVSWNSMISSYIRHKRNSDAIKLFKKMVPKGISPDEFTFSSIFKAYANLGLVAEARGTHRLLIILGLDAKNAFIGSSLVDMYSKLGRLGDSQKVYDRIDDKDVVCSTALVVGYSQNGMDNEAIAIFGDMVNLGVKANDFTFSSVLISCGNLGELNGGKSIHGFMFKSGLCSRVASQTSLLSMYSKCGLIDDSLKVFEGIDDPNIITWTAMIGCLVFNRREELALTMLRRMIHDSMTPNKFTLSSALRGCSSLALFEQGKLIHGFAVKHGLDRDRFVGAALIDTYGKCGHVSMAKSVFDCFQKFDLVLVNSMIYGYAQNGNAIEAVRLFDQVLSSNLGPNDVTYTSVLSACSNAGLVEEGDRIFSLISKKSNDHYACMVDLLGRAGKLEEAEQLITQTDNPDKVLWRTLLGACKIHGELEMAKKVARRILELDPSDEGTHVLLSNIYASLGQWDEVRLVKCAMKEMRLKKEPAMTWIEVDKKTHTFMAGDDSHPMAPEIFRELERLIEKTKELGYVPDTRFVLQEMGAIEKQRSLFYHSEKLAVAFGVLTSLDKRNNCIMIFKNLRVCGDCHSWIKLVSRVVGKEIIARDAKRFHHFKNGLCSCRDYW